MTKELKMDLIKMTEAKKPRKYITKKKLNPYYKRELRNLRKARQNKSCTYCKKSIVVAGTGKFKLDIVQFGCNDDGEINSFCNDDCLNKFERFGKLK